jgi:two-component system, OmpR family, response regulator CpxR
MRPKKQILLVDTDPDRLSCAVFMLETNGYKVFSAENYESALGLFLDEINIDLVLLGYDDEQSFAPGLAHRLKCTRSYVPILVLGQREVFGASAIQSDTFLERAKTTTAELLERIKIMSARKRGPRKGYVPHPRPVALAQRAS